MFKKTTMCVSLAVCLVFAGTANAAPVVYDLTVTTPADFGGTITLDLDFAPDESAGGVDTYEWGNDALVDFRSSAPVPRFYSRRQALIPRNSLSRWPLQMIRRCRFGWTWIAPPAVVISMVSWTLSPE